jgi:hypothetical protein
MVELKFKSIIQPASAPTSWKWELYVEGEELPVAVGFAVGTKADVEAAILKAQQFAIDNRGNRSGKPVIRQNPVSKS